ncbi:hypothetical protein [Thalassolituus hydrocarboniclasticus]|uniref:AraC family transcriptional regulator n=1 Tax=Thalassolituus hydrocarboniclasticus TaxID=2742796 RepID=A0ABY6A944_9GAMM|nr:hypothetical protein [Thalassolituus hydrocarboniclasticus]UXD87427.1 hypothetical protein HUF19_08270 [Thalassolituus hydrocarboniclasticus]
MKKLPMLTLAALFCALTVQAEPQNANIAADIVQVKRSVLELNKDLYELEEDLLSPATTRAAFYFSLTYGEFFEPLSIEVSGSGFEAVRHIYTERQVAALRMGAVQPLANINLGPGKHNLRAVIRGVDQLGQNRELVVEQQVEKSDKPLMLEFVVSDVAEQQSAAAQLKFW